MTTDPVASRRYLVSGRVQGVGYRMFAARSGRSLGLTGGASNLEDGRVIVVARGPVPLLDRLEGFLWTGPRMSRVDRVDVTAAEVETGEGLHDVNF